MENQNKKDEIQSRREFFKEAAKKALPIIGAVALMSNPVIAQAVNKESMNCENGCYGSCYGGCYYTCKDSCDSSCKDSCNLSCLGSCVDSCKGSCKDTCWKSGYLH